MLRAQADTIFNTAKQTLHFERKKQKATLIQHREGLERKLAKRKAAEDDATKSQQAGDEAAAKSAERDRQHEVDVKRTAGDAAAELQRQKEADQRAAQIHADAELAARVADEPAVVDKRPTQSEQRRSLYKSPPVIQLPDGLACRTYIAEGPGKHH